MGNAASVTLHARKTPHEALKCAVDADLAVDIQSSPTKARVVAHPNKDSHGNGAAQQMGEEAERLLTAARRGDTKSVAAVLSSHAGGSGDVKALANVRDPDGGESALMFAASCRDRHAAASMMKRLLKAGANVNTVDSAGWSALFWASDCGHAAAVKLLLSAGADASREDADGNTALDMARTEQEQRTQAAKKAAKKAAKDKDKSKQAFAEMREIDTAAAAADEVVALLEAALARRARAAYLREVYTKSETGES
jgi:hypothetical protein